MRHTLLVALLLLVPRFAGAERYAILVGSNDGHGVDVPLRYAEVDADRLAGTLVELGGFTSSQVRVLRAPSVAQVEDAFAGVGRAIASARDGNAMVFFYYSGHADGAALHLGDTSLELYRVRDLLAKTGATVRIGILDACGVGSITTREKGVEKGAPFIVSSPPELAQRGQVLIAAVSASESAQESDSLRGSFFTSYLVAGLRGAADRGGNGRVTLDDAYRYAYAQTVRATMLSRAGAQHPTYSVDLSGQGDLVLTEPGKGRSRLVFHADTAGEFAVFTPGESLIAEVAVSAGGKVLFALSPGEYELRKRSPSGLRFVRARLAEGDARDLYEGSMPTLEYVRLARKGFSPRLRVEVGYNFGALANHAGAFWGQLGVELAARKLLLQPHLTIGFTRWDDGLSPNRVPVDEGYLGGGLTVAGAWEHARWFLSLGGAIEVGTMWQRAIDQTTWIVAFKLATPMTVGVRVAHGTSVTLQTAPGVFLVPGDFGWRARPDGTFVAGARYDF